MTRTPTTFVTAIAIAARAFAGEFPSGAHFSGFVLGDAAAATLAPGVPAGLRREPESGCFPAFRFSPVAIDRRPRSLTSRGRRKR